MKPKTKCKKRKPQIEEIHVINLSGNVVPCKGEKKPNGMLLIPNPKYVKQVKRIESCPDS